MLLLFVKHSCSEFYEHEFDDCFDYESRISALRHVANLKKVVASMPNCCNSSGLKYAIDLQGESNPWIYV